VIDANTVQFYAGVGSSTPFSFAVTIANPYSAESNALTIQIGNPSPQISAVQNAASGAQGGTLQPVSAGEMITIAGVDFGSPLGISAPQPIQRRSPNSATRRSFSTVSLSPSPTSPPAR